MAIAMAAVFTLGSCALTPRERPVAQPDVVTVDFTRTLRTGADRVLGINLNYIRDSNANRPEARPLAEALRAMDVRWLRFPGGEKSDFIRWRRGSDGRMTPVTFGDYAGFSGVRMNLEEFDSVASRVGAEPLMVVGYDSKTRSGRTEAEWLADAVALVRYANVENDFRIRYWEIGNENWHNGTASPEEMAMVVKRFSKAMKAVDPSIQIGSSGLSKVWWEGFLPKAAQALDFLTVSHYNVDGWRGYSHWLKNPDANHSYAVKTALRAIDNDAPKPDVKRLKVIVAETNSLNWKGGWEKPRTVGHALVSFDTFGKLLDEPRVLSANYWTSRWIPEADPDEARYSALDRQNLLLSGGQMLAFWGGGLQSRMVPVDGGGRLVQAYASWDGRGRGTIWLLNKDVKPSQSIRVQWTAGQPFATAKMESMFGRKPNDARFQFTAPKSIGMGVSGISENLTLPPLSVTRIFLER